MTDTTTPQPPTWAEWKGDDPAPKKWSAVNPETKETVIVYRSYKDYCDD